MATDPHATQDRAADPKPCPEGALIENGEWQHGILVDEDGFENDPAYSTGWSS